MFWSELRQRVIDLDRDAQSRSLGQRALWALALLAVAGFGAVHGLLAPALWLAAVIVVALVLSLLLWQPLREAGIRTWATAVGVLCGVAVAIAVTMATGGFRSINLPVDLLALTIGSILFPQPVPVVLALANAGLLVLATSHAGTWLPWRIAVTSTAALLAGARYSSFGHAALANAQRNLSIQRAAYRLGTSVTTLDIDRIVPEMAHTLGYLVGASVAVVLTRQAEGQPLAVHRWQMPEHPRHMAIQMIELQTAAERALREGTALVRLHRTGWRPVAIRARVGRALVALAMPIEEDGTLAGAVALAGSRTHPLPRWSVEVVRYLTGQAALGIRAAQAHASTRRDALIDPITHLHNARFLAIRLEEEVARARRLGTPVSLLFMDSDSLKTTNDTFGHAFGDQLVIGLAQMIQAQIRQYDIAVRYYGGDEFLVILPDTDWPEAKEVAQRLLNAARELPVGPDGDRQGSVSIGIATFPTHADTAQDLIARADDAMYQAKEAGKDRIAVYAVRAAPTPVRRPLATN